MLQHIHGTAGARSTINVVNRSGDTLATTIADANGEWGIDAEVDVGSEVRADVTLESGRKVNSGWLTIVAETASEQSVDDVDADHDIRERLEAMYVEIAASLADGKEVDFDFMPDLLASLDRTWEDLERDALELQRAGGIAPRALY